MRRFVLVLFVLVSIWGCSSSIDTASLNSQEHYNYAVKLFEDEDYLYAINEFQSILLQYPGSAINDDSQFYLGMTYFRRDQYLLAAYEFSKLIRDIPTSPFVQESQFMLAESYYELSPPYQLDQEYTKKAIEEFQAFIDFFPTNERVIEAEKISSLNEKLAEKEYNAAVIYEKMEYAKAALKYYQYIINSFHDTKFAPMALYNKIQIEIAREMDYDILKDVSLFLEKYPDAPKVEEIKELQAKLNTVE